MPNRKSQIANCKSILVLILVSLSTNLRAADAPETPSKDVLRRFSAVDTVFDNAVKEASKTRESDPLKFIERDMTTVVGQLDAFQTNQPTQVKEQAVVSQLDEWIAALDKECKNGKPGGSLNPSKPMPDSKLGGGPGGIHDLTDPKASEKAWGQLSPKQREQILQSKTDGFPPGYEALLQSYYKRLAAEKVTDEPAAGDKTTGNAPTTAPADK